MLKRCKTETCPSLHLLKHRTAPENLLRLRWRLLLRAGAPLAPGPAAGRGLTAEEGEDPWTEGGGSQAQGAACGEGGGNEKEEEEVVHQEGIAEGTSFLEEGGPTLETEADRTSSSI